MSFVYDKREYAASTWTLEHMPLQQALAALNAHGVDNVEIWADTVHLDPRTKPDIGQVKQWLKGYGMRVHSIHAPFRNYDRPADDAEFCRMRTDNIKKTVDFAQALVLYIDIIIISYAIYSYNADISDILEKSFNQIAAYKAGGTCYQDSFIV